MAFDNSYDEMDFLLATAETAYLHCQGCLSLFLADMYNIGLCDYCGQIFYEEANDHLHNYDDLIKYHNKLAVQHKVNMRPVLEELQAYYYSPDNKYYKRELSGMHIW